jgi:hypothetical protein
MRFLDTLAAAFINTFGITQPTERARRRASWFIIGMLVGALALVFVLGMIFGHLLTHSR